MENIKRLTIVIFLFLLSFVSIAQSESRSPRFLTMEPMFTWTKSSELSVNLGYMKYKFLDEYPTASYGPFIGLGSTIGANNNALVSKLGYAHYEGFIAGRVQVLNYTNFKQSQFVLRPELGLSMLSWINLTYGYSINLYSDKNLIPISHLISISVNLSSYLLK